MSKFVVFINEYTEDERALVDIVNKEVVLHGDYYHDKIDERIEGFLNGLEYADYDYEIIDAGKLIDEKDEWFDIIGFVID